MNDHEPTPPNEDAQPTEPIEPSGIARPVTPVSPPAPSRPRWPLVVGLIAVAIPLVGAGVGYAVYTALQRAPLVGSVTTTSGVAVGTVYTNTGNGTQINLEQATRTAGNGTDPTDALDAAASGAEAAAAQAEAQARQAEAQANADDQDDGTTSNDDTVVQSSQGSNNMNIFGKNQNVSIVNGVVTINGVVQHGGNGVQGKGPVIDSVRPVAAFHRVKSSLAADITFVRGDTPSVTVKAQENLLQYIQTDVTNGTLRLQVNGSISTQHTVQIVVTSPTAPSELAFSGVGKADLGELNGDLDLDVSGSVNVQGHGDLGQVKTELSGVGAIALKGTAEKVRLDLSGTGRASLGELKAKTVKLDISGVGHATVFASERVSGDLSGVGSVTVRGNPASRDIDRSGLGQVHYEN